MQVLQGYDDLNYGYDLGCLTLPALRVLEIQGTWKGLDMVHYVQKSDCGIHLKVGLGLCRTGFLLVNCKCRLCCVMS